MTAGSEDSALTSKNRRQGDAMNDQVRSIDHFAPLWYMRVPLIVKYERNSNREDNLATKTQAWRAEKISLERIIVEAFY